MAQRLTLTSSRTTSDGQRGPLHRLLQSNTAPATGRRCSCRSTRVWSMGLRDFFANPDSADPNFQFRWPSKAATPASPCNTGWRRQYYRQLMSARYRLIVKLNGKTEVPSDAESFVLSGHRSKTPSPWARTPSATRCMSVRRPRTVISRSWDAVRRDAERLGIPTIIQAYPRGEAVGEKRRQGESWAIEYAARVAAEVGADVVKINFPTESPSPGSPKPYDTTKFSPEESIGRAVKSAGKTLVLVSGGEKEPDDELLEKPPLIRRPARPA